MSSRRGVLVYFSGLILAILLIFSPALEAAANGGYTTKTRGTGEIINVNQVKTNTTIQNELFSTTQLIQDSSFEANYPDPNPYWADFSTTWGTVLCTTIDCGTGTGTGPRSGTVWAWFGGSPDGDTGYVAQNVVIPRGKATFSFWVEQIYCGVEGAANYMRLLVDNVEIWRTDGTDSACGLLGYRKISLDFSAYADNSTHTIKFDSVTVGDSNFFVDDVELIHEVWNLYLPLVLR